MSELSVCERCGDDELEVCIMIRLEHGWWCTGCLIERMTDAETQTGRLRDALEFTVKERPCYNCDDGGDPSEALRVWCVECGGRRTEYPSAKECRDAANRALSKEPS